jgi:hypothetical protein
LFLAVVASFLRYNVHMEEITFLSSRLRMLLASLGQKHAQFSSSIIPRTRSPSNFMTILLCPNSCIFQ